VLVAPHHEVQKLGQEVLVDGGLGVVLGSAERFSTFVFTSRFVFKVRVNRVLTVVHVHVSYDNVTSSRFL
jgi:hypothetical protein